MHRQDTKLAHVKTNPTKSSQSTPTFDGFVSTLPAPCSFPFLTVSTLLVARDHHVVVP